LGLALAVLISACSDSAGARPNVILITLDTTRPDYFSCYDGEKGPTPNFDRLAAEGVRFERTLSTSAVTPVSHATILTGRYPYKHGLRVISALSGFRLPASEVTLARRLRLEGYRTLAVHSAFPVSSHFGFARDFDVFESMDGELTPEGRWDQTKLQRRSDETTAKVLEVLDATTEPFFLWIHYWDPHDAIVLPPDARKWLTGVEFDSQGDFANPGRDFDEIYAGEVRYLDQQFGGLVAGMRSRGLYDDSLVVLTADHGQGLNDGMRRHGWRAHRMLYEEQIHVPLLMRGPGLPTGRVVRGLSRTVDIVPTIYDYLGLAEVPDLDGWSLRDAIENRPGPRRTFYAEQINGYDTNARLTQEKPASAFMYTVGDEKWKLTYRPHMPDRSELFDIENDPLETNNLVGKRPDITLQWIEELAAHNPWVMHPFPEDSEGGSTDVSGALGSLGYADGEVMEMDWEWICPEHPDYRVEQPEPARHPECGRLLVLAAKAE
jgi:arylsulfatase A-like enzyme